MPGSAVSFITGSAASHVGGQSILEKERVNEQNPSRGTLEPPHTRGVLRSHTMGEIFSQFLNISETICHYQFLIFSNSLRKIISENQIRGPYSKAE